MDTPTHVWLKPSVDLPELDLSACPEIVVVAAHPDDETLGFGATATMLAELGVRVQVVSASDGGARIRSRLCCSATGWNRPDARNCTVPPAFWACRRRSASALPDGELGAHEERLADLLTEILATRPPGTWCAATWRGDGHPDHEAVGRAAAAAAARTGAVLMEYPVWMWHWALPGDPAVPWDRAYAVPLSRAAIDRKSRAAQCFRSQFEPRLRAQPVLPPSVLRRLLAVGEVVFR